jgi:hypothetical protein
MAGLELIPLLGCQGVDPDQLALIALFGDRLSPFVRQKVLQGLEQPRAEATPSGIRPIEVAPLEQPQKEFLGELTRVVVSVPSAP